MNPSGTPLTPLDCAFCGAREHSRLHVIRGLSLVQCSRCGLIYTNPRKSWEYASSGDKFEVELETYQRHYWPAR